MGYTKASSIVVTKDRIIVKGTSSNTFEFGRSGRMIACKEDFDVPNNREHLLALYHDLCGGMIVPSPGANDYKWYYLAQQDFMKYENVSEKLNEEAFQKFCSAIMEKQPNVKCFLRNVDRADMGYVHQPTRGKRYMYSSSYLATAFPFYKAHYLKNCKFKHLNIRMEIL